MIDHGQKYLFAIGSSLLLIGSFFAGNAKTVESERLGSSNNQSDAEKRQYDEHDSTSIANCMTSGCHGSRNVDAPVWQQAGRIWFDDDPHAKSFTHLLTENSMKMVENLLHRSFASVNDEAYRAFLDQRCVSCHASQQSLKERLVLGADCQVCHGPTEAWGDHHYSATWRDKKANRFEGTNMLNTENLASRAKICMSCHVGDLKNPSMEREVDHDLMAAGHPPMHFELETFLRAYPVHWDDKQDAALNGPTAARQRWEIGQLVHAQTRLELLSTRSKSVENLEKAGRVWPELTEYGCYGCHHSLIQPSWRQAQGGRAVYDWDPWSLAGLKLAISDDQQPEMDRLIANLKTTTDSVQASTSASSTHSAAEALLQFINERLRSFNSESPRSVDQIRTELKTHLQGKPDHKSWEAATQWYCMMIANVETLSAREGPKGFSPSSISNQIQTDFLNGPVMYHPMNLDSNRANLEDLLRKAQP